MQVISFNPKQIGTLLLASLLLLSTACARKVLRGNVQVSKQIVFQFTVRGNLNLNRDDLTYYVILNAPDMPSKEAKDKKTIDPLKEGPRMNGVDINQTAVGQTPTSLQGRLPFLGLITGDVQSVWTDFYYIRGTADGIGSVGRGVRRESDGVPEIVQPIYPVSQWRKVSTSSFELQIPFKDIFKDVTQIPNNISVNLGSSDSFDNGQGYVYDSWINNQPFSIDLNKLNTRDTIRDPNPNLIMRQIISRPIPQLPPGVDAGTVDFVQVEYRIIDF